MKHSSIEWFLARFETSDMMLRAAMEIPFEHQHKNCKAAFKQYIRQNPDRVEAVFNKLVEAAK